MLPFDRKLRVRGRGLSQTNAEYSNRYWLLLLTKNAAVARIWNPTAEPKKYLFKRVIVHHGRKILTNSIPLLMIGCQV
jgi:hypothetical protein